MTRLRTSGRDVNASAPRPTLLLGFLFWKGAPSGVTVLGDSTTTELGRCPCVSPGRGQQSHACREQLRGLWDSALQCLHEDIDSSRWGHFRDWVTCLRAWQTIDDQQLVIVIVTNKGKCSCSRDANKLLNHEGHRSSGPVAVIRLPSVEDTAEPLQNTVNSVCLF